MTKSKKPTHVSDLRDATLDTLSQFGVADLSKAKLGDLDYHALLAARLQCVVGTRKNPVTLNDCLTWSTGDGDGRVKKFEKLVVKLLGKELFDAAEHYARVVDVLCAVLGLGPVKAKGMGDLDLIVERHHSYLNH